MSFEEKAITVVQLFRGLTMVKTLEDLTTDAEKGIEFVAIYLADDETLKKARKDAGALLPYILQAEKMTTDEVADAIAFFTGKILGFSSRMQSGVLNKINPPSQVKK